MGWYSYFNLQNWVSQDSETQVKYFRYFLAMWLTPMLLHIFSSIIRDIIVNTSGKKVGRHFHGKMIDVVFKAPVNLYFDVTPVSKVLTKFHHDLGNITHCFHHCFNGIMSCVVGMSTCFAINAMGAPQILIAVALSVFLTHRLRS